MGGVVAHIRDTVLAGASGRARLDVVVGTHAREIFNDEFDFGSVWLAWTEDLGKGEIRKVKEAKKKAITRLQGLVGKTLHHVAEEVFSRTSAQVLAAAPLDCVTSSPELVAN